MKINAGMKAWIWWDVNWKVSERERTDWKGNARRSGANKREWWMNEWVVFAAAGVWCGSNDGRVVTHNRIEDRIDRLGGGPI
jgi:hypothetical protein